MHTRTDTSTQQELNSELKDLATRDLQLWSIGALVIVVLAIGFIAVVLPNINWRLSQLHVDVRYLPQLLFGFIILIVLFNIYLLDQRRRLNSLREVLVRKMMGSIYSGNLVSQDPLTKLFNHDHAENVINSQVKHVDAEGGKTTFIYLDIVGFKAINERFGNLAGDHLLLVLSQILKTNFRGSDVVCRYGGDEFLVVLPKTTEQEAEFAVRRLKAAITDWNESAGFTYKLIVSIAVSPYAQGFDVHVILDELKHTSKRQSAMIGSVSCPIPQQRLQRRAKL
jgi:diguanylate cyclase (GGDEF)-like protein